MSSSYPPQLHLTLPSNTTSFKRSFDQFGFDLESPVGNAEASSSSGSPGSGAGSSGNGRSKRPRSASSLSDGSDSLSSSLTFASGSSETRSSEGSEPVVGPPATSPNRSISSHILGAMPFEAPRLPTPDIQDIEMPDYPLNEVQDETEELDEHSESFVGGSVLPTVESYRSSVERMNEIDSQAYRLVNPRSPITVPRPTTPPPILPPLSLEEDQTPLHQTFLDSHIRSHLSLSNSTSDRPLSATSLRGPQASTPAMSSHTIPLTQGAVPSEASSAAHTSILGSHSEPDLVLESSPTTERDNSSFSDTLDQLLNHGQLSSFSLEFRRPERISSRTSSSVAPSGDRSTFPDHSVPSSASSLPSATSLLRRHGSPNVRVTNRSESPRRHHLSSREQDRDQFPFSSHFTSNREQSSARDDSHIDRTISPLSFSYRFPGSVSLREPLSLSNMRRQPSSASFRSDLDRWFETPSSDTVDRDRFPLDTLRLSSRLTRNPGIRIAADEDHASRAYSSALESDRARRPDDDDDDLDFESTISGLRARLLENRRSVIGIESRLSDSRSQRTPFPSVDSESHNLPGTFRRSRYIEQGLVDPREAAGRYETEDVRPPARWRFSWNDAFDLEEEDNPRTLSESERIYRISRGMGRSSTRSLGNSDRHINSSSIPTRNLPGRRTRPRHSGALSGSTSLFSENAAEMRRRDDRDVVDRLRRASSGGDFNSWELPSDDELDGDSLRSTFGRERPFLRGDSSRPEESSRSPVLPPLSYHNRSLSPPSMPRAMTELLSQSEHSSHSSSRPPINSFSSRRDLPSWYLYPESSSFDLYASSLHTRSDTPYDIRSRETGRNRNSYIPYLHRASDQHAMDSDTNLSRPRDERYMPSNRNPRWSSFDEPRRHSPALFDSQSSTISDIARTITNNEYDLASSLYCPSPSAISNNTVDADMRVISPEETFAPPAMPPSIPPPDLGNNLFDSSDPSDISPPQRFPELSIFQRYPIPLDRTASETDEPSRSLRSPSPISPIEFAYHSPPPTSSIPRNQPEPPGFGRGRIGGIDLQGFAPGPYRNTLQRLVERGRLSDSSNPPSIPPLPFESPASPLRAVSSTAVNYPRERSVQGQTQVPSLRQPTDRRISMPLPSARSSLSARHPLAETTSQRRTSDDLHRHIMNRATFEASLLEGPEMPESGNMSSELRGLDHALHVLRQDGLSEHRSQQLIERYRRQRQRQESFEGNLNAGATSHSPYNGHSLWGFLEDSRATRRDGDRNGPGHRPSPRAYRGINTNTNTTSNNSLTTPDDDMGGFVSLSGFPHRRRPASNSPTRHERTAMQDTRPAPFGRGRAFGSRFSRHRHHVDYEPEFVAFTDLIRRRGSRGNFNFGDFMRDEDFDSSYETLISLETALGEVKPRATPDHVIAGLETAFYKDWATIDSDKRCPICLDDYKLLDQVSKLPECTHWLHKPCLEQWLKGASTCPVCRENVKVQSPPSRSSTRPTRLLNTVFRNPIPGRYPNDPPPDNNVRTGSSNETSTGDRGNENPSISTSNDPALRGRDRFNRSSSNWRSVFRPPPDSGV
ncbi:hypothetical protein E1B28_005839 [Marasmius oreades]|uniref:RING-type domain-containing protein n=1 Tax=Marasmius oreades TaxID=181124 RepID=A0A9P7S3Z2_9AGAR|nr:uncharacterized protein E1B28_005839 [Marasmius oreades]KAG7095049.1 hypothetical protein E1B28_005839 [Marasmius oreades]